MRERATRYQVSQRCAGLHEADVKSLILTARKQNTNQSLPYLQRIKMLFHFLWIRLTKKTP